MQRISCKTASWREQPHAGLSGLQTALSADHCRQQKCDRFRGKKEGTKIVQDDNWRKVHLCCTAGVHLIALLSAVCVHKLRYSIVIGHSICLALALSDPRRPSSLKRSLSATSLPIGPLTAESHKARACGGQAVAEACRPPLRTGGQRFSRPRTGCTCSGCNIRASRLCRACRTPPRLRWGCRPCRLRHSTISCQMLALEPRSSRPRPGHHINTQRSACTSLAATDGPVFCCSACMAPIGDVEGVWRGRWRCTLLLGSCG